jgi:hypothetical protein
MKVNALTRKDLIAGTLIAVVMATIFTKLGGKPLLVAFIPGLAVSWLIFARLYRKQTALPESGAFFPIYFTTIAWQFIHFAEEFLTRFNERFPQLYGTRAFSPELFVSFNMASYFVFVIACLLVFTKRLNFLLIPVLFFLVYGAIGNAITHTWWVVWQRGYFPGFYTAQLYWLLGPWALSRLLGTNREALGWAFLLAVVLIPLVTVFIQP